MSNEAGSSESEVIIRKPREEDMSKVCEFISRSTGNRSHITPESLWKDLNDLGNISTTHSDGLRAAMNSEVHRTNRPVIHILVAESNSQLVGYTMYLYLYSTWRSRAPYVIDCFVEEELRKQGLARKLISKIYEIEEKGKTIKLIINAARADAELRDKLYNSGFARLVPDPDVSIVRMDL